MCFLVSVIYFSCSAVFYFAFANDFLSKNISLAALLVDYFSFRPFSLSHVYWCVSRALPYLWQTHHGGVYFAVFAFVFFFLHNGCFYLGSLHRTVIKDKHGNYDELFPCLSPHHWISRRLKAFYYFLWHHLLISVSRRIDMFSNYCHGANCRIIGPEEPSS